MFSSRVPHLHALNLIPSIGPKSLEKLLSYFEDDPERAWRAPAADLRSAGLTEKTVADIVEKRNAIDPLQAIEDLKKHDIETLSHDDPRYPALLKETPSAPALLYMRGSCPKDGFSLAVVGTRRPTSYGQEITHTITKELARAGVTIVSGLALGVDGIAHKAALEEHGSTIAVLGSGIDDNSIYPSFHKPLARDILSHGGAIVSEFPPGTPALKHHFPQRNRIISGITKGTIVTEAKKQSGALITARYALEYNRDVFAVPGSILSAFSEGPHSLIRGGAIPVMSARDILEEYGIESQTADAPHVPHSDLEKEILELLHAPRTFEDIQTALHIETSVLNAALAVLELNEFVTNLGNRTYVKKI